MDKEQKNLNRYLKIVLKILGLLGLVGVGAILLFIAIQFDFITGVKIQSDSNAQTQDGAIAQAHQIIHLDSSREAKINEKFDDDIKACWYYQATYKTLHPYTVLWEEALCQKWNRFKQKWVDAKCDDKDVRPILKIRVVADKGIWDANTCIKEKDDSDDKMIVKLIGEESIKHRIEAQFKEDEPYDHIADTEAKYHTTLHFDDKGNIELRRVKKTDIYKCIFPDDSLFKEVSESSIPSSCEPEYNKVIESESESENKKDDSINYKNELTIDGPIVDLAEEIKVLKYKLTDNKEEPEKKEFTKDKEDKEKKLRQYMKPLEFYIKKRSELHDDLVKNGCGALTMLPDYIANKKSEELERPSIIYVCLKKGKKSHVRVMVRESLEDKKQREKESQKEKTKKANRQKVFKKKTDNTILGKTDAEIEKLKELKDELSSCLDNKLIESETCIDSFNKLKEEISKSN